MIFTNKELKLIRDLLIDESEMDNYPENKSEIVFYHEVHDLIDRFKLEITKRENYEL